MDEKLTELLKKVRENDPSAFAQLSETYRPMILSLVERVLPSMPERSGREDLLQEASIALYRAAMSFDLSQDKVTFGLFAKICVKNRLLSALRKQRRLAKKPSVPPVQNERAKDWEAIKGQLSGMLTKYEEQVLALRLDNYSYKEIAKKLQKDPKSVDNALCRIRQKARLCKNEHKTV